ncbi:hypothetical protein ALQ16_200309 [Pseudomonas syringae pv. actinidiae]|nr:hypothetical protein ALQ16_200309 [Pseudomonas syringae pv. actinidiae]
MAHKKRDQAGVAILAIADALYAEHLKRLASHADAKRIEMFPVSRSQRSAQFQTTRLSRKEGAPVKQIQE